MQTYACQHSHNTNIDLLTVQNRKREGTKKGQTRGTSQNSSATDTKKPTSNWLNPLRGVYWLSELKQPGVELVSNTAEIVGTETS